MARRDKVGNAFILAKKLKHLTVLERIYRLTCVVHDLPFLYVGIKLEDIKAFACKYSYVLESPLQKEI